MNRVQTFSRSLGLGLLMFCTCVCAENVKISKSVDTARRITGHFEKGSSISKMKVKEWDPLDANDMDYVGPTKAEPGKWFRVEAGAPETVNSEADLQRLVYHLAKTLTEQYELDTSKGADKQKIEKWLKRCANSLYGTFSVEENEGKLTLLVKYSSDARILAAFRNPDLQEKLEDEEKKVLNTCAEWIADNITEKMPNGLKLKKIHDALVDNSSYTKGHHKTAEIVLDGEGVCSAYTTATQLLLHMVKIDCRRVRGSEKMNHTWDLLELNDNWYHLDVTWDDPVGGAPRRLYTYYLLTDAEMAVDHDWVDKDCFEKTQLLNPWHFNKSNLMRRSWQENGTGYTLPREDDKGMAQDAYDMHTQQAVQTGEKLANVFGYDLKRKEKAEQKVKVNDARGSSRDVGKSWSKSLPKLSRKKKGEETDASIKDVKDFNKQLEQYVNELAGPTLAFQCKKDMPDWEMRKIVASSSISAYAERYAVVYDVEKSVINIEMEYWTHVRLLTAANDENLQKLLSSQERNALNQCKTWATSINANWKNSRQKVLDSYLALMNHFSPIGEYTPLTQACSSRKCNSLGYAQAMYVVLNLMDLPCIMVHGRTKEGDHVWNMVRLNKRDWYHLDSMLDDYRGRKSEKTCQFFLQTDEVMREEHIWPATEYPLSSGGVKKMIPGRAGSGMVPRLF